MKKLFLFLLLAGQAVCASASTPFTATGHVYDHSGAPLSGVVITEKNTTNHTTSSADGYFQLLVQSEQSVLVFNLANWQVREVKVSKGKPMVVKLKEIPAPVVAEEEIMLDRMIKHSKVAEMSTTGAAYNHSPQWHSYPMEQQNTEEYATVQETGFKSALDAPLSTFSIDVDAASYSNVRRFIMNGQLPPKDAVRVEEMINYFDYSYETPKGQHPFAIHTGLVRAPWNENHLLARVALKGMEIDTKDLPASNLVFLIDVSGSMDQANKLPLLKSSFKLLVSQLRAVDRVSIVVYAGAAGLVLPPTPGNDNKTILAALDKLNAGGSTAGGAGIRLAYQTAKDNFIKNGNNRIILATDGDFNVGESSNDAMEKLIEEKRKEGVFLTLLGYGMGNYKDSKMELLADKGNGNYAYIDNMTEAYKVLISEFSGTLYTIAKDVKIQVEFNPAYVQAYRLIGYENRRLKDEEFNNDKKDAGDLGSGHTVTALYEIVPVGSNSTYPGAIDPLKYQKPQTVIPPLVQNSELLTVKFRYKAPDGETSKLLSHVLSNKVDIKPGEDMLWATAVAGFGMMLSGSEYADGLTNESVLAMAKLAKGKDEKGYRAEFIKLVELAGAMASQ